MFLTGDHDFRVPVLIFLSPGSSLEHWHNMLRSKRSCPVVSDSSEPHGPQPTRLCGPWDFQAGMGDCHSLLQGSSPSESATGDLLHCRRHLPCRPRGKSFSTNYVCLGVKVRILGYKLKQLHMGISTLNKR